MDHTDIIEREAADPRTGEILDQIRATFVEKGFDGASMQELARSAGMSAGNFYRYFPSKTAIVEALIARDLTEVMEDFAVVIRSADPLESLRTIVSRRVAIPAPDRGAELWAEMEAVASRESGVGAMCTTLQTGIDAQIIGTFARIAGRSADYMRRTQSHSVDALMLLVKGAAIRACRPTDATDPEAFHALVMRLFDTIMADIAALAEACPDATNPGTNERGV